MPRRLPIPDAIEDYRDVRWLRTEMASVNTAQEAERFIEDIGFAGCLTDARRPGPSLYIAVCGRRDAIMPPNVQKDPESALTWQLKDAVMKRGRVYYAKLSRGKTMFLAPRMIPYFKALWGIPPRQEGMRLSPSARSILGVLRREWEMATADLRSESGVTDRKTFTRAMDELQAAMLVVPSEAIYHPKFTYLWELATERFPDELAARKKQLTAVREVARCYLDGAGLTLHGELARVTGLSRVEAGIGNQVLVREGFAQAIAPGTYRLSRLSESRLSAGATGRSPK